MKIFFRNDPVRVIEGTTVYFDKFWKEGERKIGIIATTGHRYLFSELY